jgi:hypothetical protein
MNHLQSLRFHLPFLCCLIFPYLESLHQSSIHDPLYHLQSLDLHLLLLCCPISPYLQRLHQHGIQHPLDDLQSLALNALALVCFSSVDVSLHTSNTCTRVTFIILAHYNLGALAFQLIDSSLSSLTFSYQLLSTVELLHFVMSIIIHRRWPFLRYVQ